MQGQDRTTEIHSGGAKLGEMIVPRHQGKWIYYDGEAGKITNVAEANQYLPREYRKGWIL